MASVVKVSTELWNECSAYCVIPVWNGQLQAMVAKERLLIRHHGSGEIVGNFCQGNEIIYFWEHPDGHIYTMGEAEVNVWHIKNGLCRHFVAKNLCQVEYVKQWGALVVGGDETLVFSSPEQPGTKIEGVHQVTLLQYVEDWGALIVGTAEEGIWAFTSPKEGRRLKKSSGTTKWSLRYVSSWGALVVGEVYAKDTPLRNPQSGPFAQPDFEGSAFVFTSPDETGILLQGDFKGVRQLRCVDEWNSLIVDAESSFLFTDPALPAKPFSKIDKLLYVEAWNAYIFANNYSLFAQTRPGEPCITLQGPRKVTQILYVEAWKALVVGTEQIIHGKSPSSAWLFTSPEQPGVALMGPERQVSQLLYVESWQAVVVSTSHGIFSFAGPEQSCTKMEKPGWLTTSLRYEEAWGVLVGGTLNDGIFSFESPKQPCVQMLGPNKQIVAVAYVKAWGALAVGTRNGAFAFMETEQASIELKGPKQEITQLQYVDAWDTLFVSNRTGVQTVPGGVYAFARPDLQGKVVMQGLMAGYSSFNHVLQYVDKWNALVVGGVVDQLFAVTGCDPEPSSDTLWDHSAIKILQEDHRSCDQLFYVDAWDAIIASGDNHDGALAFTGIEQPGKKLAMLDRRMKYHAYIKAWNLLVVATGVNGHDGNVVLAFSSHLEGKLLKRCDVSTPMQYVEAWGVLCFGTSHGAFSFSSPDEPGTLLKCPQCQIKQCQYVEAWRILVVSTASEGIFTFTGPDALGKQLQLPSSIGESLTQVEYIKPLSALIVVTEPFILTASAAVTGGRACALNAVLFNDLEQPGRELVGPSNGEALAEVVPMANGAALLWDCSKSVTILTAGADFVVAHSFTVQKVHVNGSELWLLSGADDADVTVVSLGLISWGILAVQHIPNRICGVSKDLLLEATLYIQAVILKAVTFGQLAAFAFVGTPLPEHLKRPGALLENIQTFGIHWEYDWIFPILFAASQVVSWIIICSFLIILEPAKSAKILTPEARWPKLFFDAFAAFCRYAMGPLLIPILRCCLWPAANWSSVKLWWPLRLLGVITALCLVIIAVRLARVDHILKRIEVVHGNMFRYSKDMLPSLLERKELYRHPLSPKTPAYDLGKITVKAVLTVSLLFVVPCSPVLGAAIRVIFGIALLVLNFKYDAYFEVVGPFWNAVGAAGDAGILATYVATLCACLVADDQDALNSHYMNAVSVACFPAAAFVLFARWKCRTSSPMSATPWAASQPEAEPLLLTVDGQTVHRQRSSKFSR